MFESLMRYGGAVGNVCEAELEGAGRAWDDEHEYPELSAPLWWMVGMGVQVGKVLLFETRRVVPEETINKIRRSELALSCIEDAVDHLASLPPYVGMSAGDWNVHSTRAQFALGRMLTAMEKAEPWVKDAAGARERFGCEWEEIFARVRKEGRNVAALASALCCQSMPPADRCQTQSTIAAEVPHLIAELDRARTLFQECA
jgi:hypothetical protein